MEYFLKYSVYSILHDFAVDDFLQSVLGNMRYSLPRRSKLKSIRCRASWQMELFSKAKNFALQLRFIATPSSQKSTDFCDVL